MARRLGPDGVIVINGGGNLGDVWQRHQQLRELVIKDFPTHAIVQLPQTVHFVEAEALAQARAIFDAHPRLTVLVRDEPSLELARNTFRCTTLLCPDAAFYLGPLARPRTPHSDIMWLRREDREAVLEFDAHAERGIVVGDWLEADESSVQRLRGWIEPMVARAPAALAFAEPIVGTLYDTQAQDRLEAGCLLLAQGEVVITDRLHAHILCLLMEIPQVLLDNSYGKVKRFHDCWTAAVESVTWADSPRDALRAARALVAGGVGR